MMNHPVKQLLFMHQMEKSDQITSTRINFMFF